LIQVLVAQDNDAQTGRRITARYPLSYPLLGPPVLITAREPRISQASFAAGVARRQRPRREDERGVRRVLGGFDGSRDSAAVLVDAGTAHYQEKKLPDTRKIESVDLTNNFAEVRDCRVQNLASIRNLIAFGALPARPRNRIEI
jgi:hypothetical protein